MKLLLIIILGLCFIYLGYGIKQYYAKRTQFYEAFVRFLNILTSEIEFLKNDIVCVSNSHVFGGGVDKVLSDYINNKSINISFLQQDEIDEIVGFLNNIGTKDVYGELNNINYYKTIFDDKLFSCKNDGSINGNMWYKLTALAGIIMCIVLI